MQSSLPFSQADQSAEAPDPAVERIAPPGSGVQSASEQDSLVRSLIRGTLLGGATIIGLRLFLVDPDLWGHLRFGLDVLSTLGVHEGDPYSFTSDRVWINHEWVFEVLLALFYSIGGTGALAVFVGVIGLATLALAWVTIHRAGVRGWPLDLLSLALFAIGIVPLIRTARPQAMSLLSFVALLALMREFDRGRHRALFALPVLFLLWANAHGGWIMGGGVLAIWTLVRMAGHPEARIRLMLLGAGVASLAATLVNPYGIELWRFLLETVRFERSDIEEWQPVTAFSGRLGVWLGTVAVAALCAIRSRREDLASIAVCLFLGVSAFLVLRVGPFFSLAVLILLAPRLVGREENIGQLIPARSMAGAVIAWIICAGLATASPSPLSCLRPVPRLLVDARAGSFLRENEAKGKLLVWFNWGEYALWHLSPGLRVSMDGRRETVYSEGTIASHLEFYRNGPGARRYLERLAPDYVWLPKSLPVSNQISGWGWQPIFESEMSTIWARHAAPGSWHPPQLGAPACFPEA